MSCRFTIDVDGEPADFIARARRELLAIGGTMRGDSQAGEVAADTPFGRIEGSYAVSGNAVSFDITKKPMLVPCSSIESQIRGLL
jgi:hypothetical protein